jgi:hypothetical protein
LLPGELKQRFAGRALHVGRVDDGEARLLEALRDDEIEDGEGVGGRRLVVFVVGDEAPAEVRGDDRGWGKVPAANELLPEPEAPTRTTRLGSGRSILIG